MWSFDVAVMVDMLGLARSVFCRFRSSTARSGPRKETLQLGLFARGWQLGVALAASGRSARHGRCGFPSQGRSGEVRILGDEEDQRDFVDLFFVERLDFMFLLNAKDVGPELCPRACTARSQPWARLGNKRHSCAHHDERQSEDDEKCNGNDLKDVEVALFGETKVQLVTPAWCSGDLDGTANTYHPEGRTVSKI